MIISLIFYIAILKFEKKKRLCYTRQRLKQKIQDSMKTNKNLYKTSYWHREAAENEDIENQYRLAFSYESEEIEKNFKSSFYWYQRAAENGDIKAQYNLALSYKNGEGA